MRYLRIQKNLLSLFLTQISLLNILQFLDSLCRRGGNINAWFDVRRCALRCLNEIAFRQVTISISSMIFFAYIYYSQMVELHLDDVFEVNLVTMSWNKDHGGVVHIFGTSLHTSSLLYIASPKTYFLIKDTYFRIRP